MTDKEKILAYHKYLTEELSLDLNELWVDKFVKEKLINNIVDKSFCCIASNGYDGFTSEKCKEVCDMCKSGQ